MLDRAGSCAMPLFERSKTEAETVLLCPHDGHAMGNLAIAGATIDRCERCGGSWFDAKELRRVAGDKEVEKRATRIPINAVESAFPCPRCGGRCVEGHVEEVVVDHCLDCNGVWLDAGELAEAKRQVHADRAIRAQGAGFRDFLGRL